LSGNYAVMVDAGFLRAAGARTLGLKRDRVAFDGHAFLQWCDGFPYDKRFARVGAVFADRAFLRTYWYDAAFDPAHRGYFAQRTMFDALALVPGLRLRLGHVQERRPGWQHGVRQAVKACGVALSEFEKHFDFRAEREQKGVDALMTLDLVQLSRDRVVDAVLLVSGDRDLAEAVRLAGSAGCRVIVAHPPAAGVSHELKQLADNELELERADLERMLVPRRLTVLTGQPDS
jgi:uncharacterized LabA/DUF88 family protein